MSAFRLDKYEVTVGRFANYIASYDAWRASGAPTNLTGWSSLVTNGIASDAATLISRAQCEGQLHTWGGASTKPINCITWYDAIAFCAWDGGALPFEFQWKYVANQAVDQTTIPYPWGVTPPGNDTNLAVYGCWLDGAAGCSGLEIAAVGSVPAGNGRLGQADLAGNVAEWVWDAAAATVGNQALGGSWDSSVTSLMQGQVMTNSAANPSRSIGFRCAR